MLNGHFVLNDMNIIVPIILIVFAIVGEFVAQFLQFLSLNFVRPSTTNSKILEYWNESQKYNFYNNNFQ